MNWHVEGRVRATIHAFTGVNFSGQRATAEIWPAGGLQGDAIDGRRIKCVGLIAPVGTRIILATSGVDEGWERLPWRAIEIRDGSFFTSREGRPAVQIPDLDRLDAFAAQRTDPELVGGYPAAEDPTQRPAWTYGRSGALALKCNIRQIRVDRA